MAVSTTSIVGNTIGTATSGFITTANNNTTVYNPYGDGYNVASDTIYGVPSYEWQRLSASDQRYYAERYRQREYQEREYRYRKEMDRMHLGMAEQTKVPVKKAPASDYMNNTLLLLEN